MRLGLNILYLIPGAVGGTETYARELIREMTNQLESGDELIIYASKETAPTFNSSKQVRIVTVPIYAKNRFSRLLSEQLLLPLYLIRDRISVVFSLGYSSPLLHHCPAVVTIHDLNWYYHPEDFSAVQKIVWKYLTLLSMHSATHIFSISQSTTRSLIEIIKIKDKKITTILHGAPQKRVIISKKGIANNEYIFSVLAGYPHKNLITLLKVFLKLSKQYPKLNLVICGLSGRADALNSNFILKNSLQSKVKLLGYVDNETLASLYSQAKVFVFPSAYEGFGIPVLEAMSYGVPVISSNAYSLAEVVGNGGILVDPYNVDDYVSNITSIMDSNIQRKRIVESGYKRIAELKWEKSASKYLHTLRKLIYI